MSHLVIVLLATIVFGNGGRQEKPWPEAEILVPTNMPMHANLSSKQGPNDQSTTVYTVTRRVDSSVRSAHFVIFMTDSAGRVLPEFTQRFLSTKVSDPMTLAVPPDRKVAKIWVVVESIQTHSGEWVLDNRPSLSRTVEVDKIAAAVRKHDEKKQRKAKKQSRAILRGRFIPEAKGTR